MTRKKFVKQIMAQGIQRNKADRLAATTRKKATPYGKGLGIFLNTYAIFLNSGDNPAANGMHPWFYSAPLQQFQGRGTA